MANGVELEAMRKDTFSWHPCSVSHRSGELGLIVQYEDDLEEKIADKEGVLARIRVRSTPLQGDDCSSLRQGDHVLATRNPHVKGVFYDARVEEVNRVRHSKRIHCRCSFAIKWLCQALEGETLTVPASAIMKLSTKSIDLHPTISTFFSMLDFSTGLTLPSSSIIGTMNSEMDINMLLEKQIEEIRNSTDVSKKMIPKNFAFEFKVDLSHGSVTMPLLNNLTRSSGSDNKYLVETTIENPPTSITSGEEDVKIRLLSPLAARAALASLRSKSAELSPQSHVKKEDINCSPTTKDLTREISDISGGVTPKCESIVKTLFPTSDTLCKVENVPRGAQVKGNKRKSKNSEEKISEPSERRLTRAQVQINTGTHDPCNMTNTEERETKSSSKMRRVTRSTVNGAEKTVVGESTGAVEENMPSEFVKLDIPAESTIAPQSCSTRNKKPVASPIDGATIICSSDRGARKRLTRSAAREETEKNNVQSKLKSREKNFSESNKIERNVTPESNKWESETPITSPIASKIVEEVTGEREKSRRTRTHEKATPNVAGTTFDSGQGVKRKSASTKRQETPVSHRPLTRSRSKI